jgi:hypothetical protein
MTWQPFQVKVGIIYLKFTIVKHYEANNARYAKLKFQAIYDLILSITSRIYHDVWFLSLSNMLLKLYIYSMKVSINLWHGIPEKKLCVWRKQLNFCGMLP